MEGKDHELGLECVRAYNDWMIDEWCGDSDGHLIPAVPDPAVGRRARGRRGASATRRAARARSASARSRRTSACRASTPATGIRCSRCARRRAPTLCMHIGSSSKMPAASPDAPPSTDIMLSFNNSMASLADFLFSGVLVRFPELKLAYSEGQIGWIPYALERADNTWEYHSNWTRAKETIPEPPSTYYQGRIFGCFTNDVHGVASIAEVGEDNICFETDYPHTDTTWPFAREEVERMTASLDRRAALQGAARQRDPDARPRPRLNGSSRRSARRSPRPCRQNSHVSSAVRRIRGVLDETIAEPAVHHGLLNERRGAARCRRRSIAPAAFAASTSSTIMREIGAIAAFTRSGCVDRELHRELHDRPAVVRAALARLLGRVAPLVQPDRERAQAVRADRTRTRRPLRRSSIASRMVSSNSASSSSSLPSKYW